MVVKWGWRFGAPCCLLVKYWWSWSSVVLYLYGWEVLSQWYFLKECNRTYFYVFATKSGTLGDQWHVVRTRNGIPLCHRDPTYAPTYVNLLLRPFWATIETQIVHIIRSINCILYKWVRFITFVSLTQMYLFFSQLYRDCKTYHTPLATWCCMDHSCVCYKPENVLSWFPTNCFRKSP